MLIVLDNAQDEAQVRPLLPGSPACVVAGDQPQPAGRAGGHRGRPAPPARPAHRRGGSQLLVSRLGTERVAAESGEAAELTALCAGLPLALAITAAKAVVQPDTRSPPSPPGCAAPGTALTA